VTDATALCYGATAYDADPEPKSLGVWTFDCCPRRAIELRM
jgi:hypothetical protein